MKPFLDQPLIERMVRRLMGTADELLVTTNNPQAYTFLHLPLIPDIVPGQGALGGLYTALSAAHSPFVAVVACDMPFVLPELLQAQHDLLVQEDLDVVIPRSEKGLEPLHAVYRRDTCLPAVLAALQAGERRMISWFENVKVREMTLQEMAAFDPQFLSLTNVNSPDEFQAAETLARVLDG